jgi:CheY-like chemotaxis protein
MRVPRVLLVDDERQVSRMLRSSLELSGRDVVVVDVPSGEEAVSELGRGPVDLLVSDLRLHGMTGLELLAQVRQRNPEARAILISGQPTPEEAEQAESLGVVAFIPRPVGTNFFLEAVDRALNLTHPTVLPVRVHEEGRAALAERLINLLGEVGAAAAYLVDESGRMVVQAGDLGDVDLKPSMALLVAAFRTGLKISSGLGSLLPANFQYFDGDIHDIYLTNVGSYYGLLIAFDGKQPADKMPVIVRLGRRAADDMLSILSRLGPPGTGPLSRRPIEKAAGAPATGPLPSASDMERAAKSIDRSQADRFWDDAAEAERKQTGEEGSLTFEEARKMGLIPDQPET